MSTAPSHIVVVNLENENFSDIVGNTAEAPFLNQLISEGMLFTNYDGVAHPSQDNYIALFSGSTQGAILNNVPSQYPASVPTLASALADKGYTFGGYAETGAAPQRTPWLDFANSAADAYDFSAFPQTAAGFANLPTVSFVTPNDADNMTPISDTGGGIAAGDAWVLANLGAYAAWAENPANNSLLIVTFDENNTNPAVTYPNHVATIVVGAGVPAGVTNDSPADTYSLLSSIESLYGLTPVGVSAGAAPLDFYSSTPPTAATAYITDPFSGISDSTNTPPQNAFAVSPAYILMAETTHYEITDLSGNPIVANGSLYSIFSPLGGTLDNNLLDARAAYDSSTGRFVVIADNFQPVLSGQTNFGTNIDIAVSVDSNPADGWYLASIDTSNGFTTQSDMPYLSVSNGNIYVSTPETLDAGGGYGTAELVVSESAVIAAGNSAITPGTSNVPTGAGGIMRNVAGDNGTSYYLAAYSDGRETALTYQTYDPTNGFSATQTIFLGDADVGGGGIDYTAAQQGTTKLLDIGDSRLQSLAYASSGGHNYIYGVSEAMPSAGSAAEIEWFQIDVTDPANPQYVNGNVISGASLGTGVAVFNPSIAVDANGDVLINFSASGPNLLPSDYYTVLGAGTSAFSAPTLYEASTTFFDSGTLNDQRWGTYSTAVADPNNANGFWFSNEYVDNTATGPSGQTGWWSTIAAQIQVGAVIAPPVLSGAANTVDYNEGGAAVTIDPGLTVSDAGSTTLDSATATISGVLLAGDTLAFTPTSGITGSYNPASGVLTFSGNASLTAYQAALQSVVYSSTSTDATSSDADLTRTITWTATSAGTTSLPVTSVIDIVPPPPPPNPAVVTTQFSGLSDPSGNYPPENGLAVGPSNVVMAETTNYEITNLSGGATTTATLGSLFSSLGTTLDNSLLDARAAYDSSTGQFVLIAENFQPGGGNFLTNIDIAVSKDSNLADGWSVASIDTSQGGTMQSDMPYLSVAGGNISISTPEYLDAGGYGGTGQWVLSESSVVAGSLNTVSNLAPAANFIMRGAADANGVSYFVGAHSDGSQTLLSYQTYSASGGYSAPQTIALRNSDLGLGSGSPDLTVQQNAGANLTLDAGDSRVESLVYANGYLWGVSEVMPSGSTTPEIHWFKLDVSNPAAPKIAAQGDISGAEIGSGVGAFNASIAVDGNGAVLINFTASGSSLTPSDYYVTMGAGASVFSAPTLYQSSTSYFQQTSGATGAQRWGVYSSATADPNNPNAFWISNEYVTNQGVTIPGGLNAWWSTVTAQVAIPSALPNPATVAQYLAATSLYDQISGGFTIADSATNIATNIGSLLDPNINSITATGGVVPVSVATYVADQSALDKIISGFAISDTAANISTSLDQLTDANIQSITVSDNNPVGVNVSQLTIDAAVIAKLADQNLSPVSFAVTDTAANISGALNALQGLNLASITISDNGAIGVSIAQLTSDATAISKLANQNATPYQLAVTDTASNVTVALSALESDAAQIASINVSGGPVVVSVATYLADKSALDKIVGGFAISDTASDIAGGLDQLNDANIQSITISDNGAIGVNAAQLTSDATAISKLADQNASPYQLAVTDTASNVTGALSTLELDAAHLASINVSGGPVVVSVATDLADKSALDKIVGGFQISDSVLTIIANLSAINADTNVAILAATSGTGTLSGGQSIVPPVFSLSGSGTTLTVSENTTYAGALSVGAGATLQVSNGVAFTTTGAFSAGAGATVDLPNGNFVLNGANSFSGATLTGAHALMVTAASSVSGLTIGGTTNFENSGTLTQSGGTVTVGDSIGDAAALFNFAPGTYDIADDSGIAQGTSTASLFVNYGLFAKTGGTGTSAVLASVISTGTVTAATGTIAFSGAVNTFSGTIGGAGAVSFTGGWSRINSGTTVSVASLTATGASTTLVIAGDLSYAGSFSDASGALLSISSGATLSLSGAATLSAKVAGAGSLAITGGTTSILPSAALSVANLSVTGAATTLAIGEAFTFAHVFSAGAGATLNLSGGNLVLSGANSLNGATVTGGRTLVDTAASSISGLTIGGTTIFRNNSTLTQSGGTVTVGDASGAATLVNGATGIYDITDGSGIAQGSSTASLFANYGLFEKTGGTGTSNVQANVTSGGIVTAATGTIAFSGASNIFWGTINGAGAVSFTGGVSTIKAATTVNVASLTATGPSTTLMIAGDLSYAGSFSDDLGATLLIGSGATLSLSGAATLSSRVVGAGSLAITGGTTSITSTAAVSVANLSVTGIGTSLVVGTLVTARAFSAGAGATLNLSGGNLVLSGANSFNGATVTGGNTLVDAAASSVSGLTIGGTTTFRNNSTLTQSGGTVMVGDASGNAGTLVNGATGIYDVTDGSGIAQGSSTASQFANYGLFEKTGTGTSVIAPNFVNGNAVSVSSGTLDFAGAVTGTGTDTISGGATLEFDSTVAAGQTIDFAGANGVLDLSDPTGFSGSISGFAKTDTIDFAGSWSLLSVTPNSGGTMSTLTLSNGAATDIVHLVGDYAKTDFTLASGAGSTTILGHV